MDEGKEWMRMMMMMIINKREEETGKDGQRGTKKEWECVVIESNGGMGGGFPHISLDLSIDPPKCDVKLMDIVAENRFQWHRNLDKFGWRSVQTGTIGAGVARCELKRGEEA